MNAAKRSGAMVVAVLLVVLVTGCGDAAEDTGAGGQLASQVEGGDGDAGGSSSTAPPTTAADTSSTTVASSPAETGAGTGGPTVELIEAGAEPRTELRLRIPDGTEQQMVSTMTQELAQELDGTPLSAVSTVVITETDIAAFESEQGYEVRSVVTAMGPGPDVEPAAAAAIEAAAAEVIGLVESAELDDRGVIISQEASATGNEAIDATVEAFAGLSSPLPSEPVGVGASWSVAQPIALAGIEMTQVSTYTLAEIDGDTVVLDIAITQSVEPGAQLVEGNVTLDVVEWTGSGTGRAVVDLTALVPTSSVTMSSTQVFGVPGSDERLTQTVDVVVAVEQR